MFNAGASNGIQVAAVTSAGLRAHVTTGLLYLSDVDRMQAGYANEVAC